MRHTYFYMMTLSYMTLKTKNPSFLNSCADKIVCMFKLVPFHTKVWQEMIGAQLRNCDFFSTISVRDTIQIPLKGS